MRRITAGHAGLKMEISSLVNPCRFRFVTFYSLVVSNRRTPLMLGSLCSLCDACSLTIGFGNRGILKTGREAQRYRSSSDGSRVLQF